MNKQKNFFQRLTIILSITALVMLGSCGQVRQGADIPDPKKIDKQFEYGNTYPDYLR
jgi:hypothetical protein